ncbi:hypothetical protein JBL43_16440 [Aureibaculum sp. A20]|uniref:Uncharacterized protein n=1 Tax=Aureibaculum flavum TaxID=2795986 RepID=A0ABS0WV35_9FLAO|nr:hypothetical protein [Aureibaculum flavum]MBJ2175844.1 hypothetical protein [Aureibaculum flavum]
MKTVSKFIVLISSMIIVISCSNAQKKQKNYVSSKVALKIDTITEHFYLAEEIKFDSIASGLNFKAGKSYHTDKSKIEKQRLDLSIKYKNTLDTIAKNELLSAASEIFKNELLNTIIPHWYETVWDFNGHTSKPNQGTIACGYFVSTTLRDMGLHLNRYKLAQQGPENEAKSIAINSNALLNFSEDTISEQIKKLEDGVYFIGLDNHVGYLYINNSNSYFIHSNYIDGKVMIEYTLHSDAFNSHNYYISKITGNTLLIEKWLKKEEIKIETN